MKEIMIYQTNEEAWLVQILHILPQEVELTQESIVRKMHSVNNTFRNGTNWQGIPDNSNDSGNE